MVESQKGQRHLLVETGDILAIGFHAQLVEMLLRAGREQVQIAEMLVIHRLNPPRPLSQLGELVAPGLVPKEIAGQSGMIHKAAHGLLGFFFQFRATDNQFDTCLFRRIEPFGYRIGAREGTEVQRKARIPQLFETLHGRLMRGNTVPSQNRQIGRLDPWLSRYRETAYHAGHATNPHFSFHTHIQSAT